MARVDRLTVGLSIDVPKETVELCEKILIVALNSFPDEENVVYIAGKESVRGYYRIIEQDNAGLALRRVGDQHE